MLGRAAADSLKKRVGDSVKIYNTNYRVVGIFETGVSFEDGSGLVSLAEAQRIFTKPHQVNMYGVKLEKPEDADRVRRLITDRVHGVTVSRSAEFAENTQDIQVTRAMAWGISVISILAGGIGMMNTVLMSVFERTREIGVLRALGWRRRWVIQLVLQESLLLSALGAVLGCLLGVGLSKLIGLTAVGGLVPAAFSPELFVQVFVIALLLGAIGGLYPAMRAANLRPVEAIRHE
jgi:ABC-type lipoprotein release transport system permease subunit